MYLDPIWLPDDFFSPGRPKELTITLCGVFWTSSLHAGAWKSSLNINFTAPPGAYFSAELRKLLSAYRTGERSRKKYFILPEEYLFSNKDWEEGRGKHTMKTKHLPIVILKVKEQYGITSKCCGCRWVAIFNETRNLPKCGLWKKWVEKLLQLL